MNISTIKILDWRVFNDKCILQLQERGMCTNNRLKCGRFTYLPCLPKATPMLRGTVEQWRESQHCPTQHVICSERVLQSRGFICRGVYNVGMRIRIEGKFVCDFNTVIVQNKSRGRCERKSRLPYYVFFFFKWTRPVNER